MSTWPRDKWTVANATWMHGLGLPKLVAHELLPACHQAVYAGPLHERFGPNWLESEWALCDDLKPPCLVFSFGIGNNWQFDLAAAARGCEVHSFDPTPELRKKHERNVAKYAHAGVKLHFHYLGLGASTNVTSDYGHTGLGPVAHLDELIRRFANGRRLDVLKADCEGCEWEELSYLATFAPSTLCTVSMLEFEWHFTSTLRFGGTRVARHAFRHLRRHGFHPTVILEGGRNPAKHPHVEASLAREAASHGSDLTGICCYTVHLRRDVRHQHAACAAAGVGRDARKVHGSRDTSHDLAAMESNVI